MAVAPLGISRERLVIFALLVTFVHRALTTLTVNSADGVRNQIGGLPFRFSGQSLSSARIGRRGGSASQASRRLGQYTLPPSGIFYHNGSIMYKEINVYLVYYGTPWESNANIGVLSRLIQSLTSTGAPDFVQWWNILQLYYDARGNHVSPSVLLANSVYDEYSQGKGPLLDSNIQAIITSVIEGSFFPKDDNAIYVILPSADVAVSGLCAIGQPCSYRSSFPYKRSTLKYIVVPDPTYCPQYCAQQFLPGNFNFKPPNGDPGIDAMASLLIGEIASLVTDPNADGWYVPATPPYTAGSLCGGSNVQWGATQTDPTTGGTFNVRGLFGSKFLIQTVFDPWNGYCALALPVPPGRCGQAFGGFPCSSLASPKLCCSLTGYCGASSSFCAPSSCQQQCTAPSPPPPPPPRPVPTLSPLTLTTSFSFSSFRWAPELLLSGTATRPPATSTLELTPRSSGSLLGRALYGLPVQFADFSSGSCSALSFSASFSFRITRAGADGLALVALSSVPAATVGTPGPGLGYDKLAGPSFAVEFDTAKDAVYLDPDANHVGLDINGSAVSRSTASLPALTLSLNDGTPKYAWLDFAPSTKTLAVRVSATSARPAAATLSARLDTCSLLSPTRAYLYVGFSAGSSAAQAHEILSWAFSSSSSSPSGSSLCGANVPRQFLSQSNYSSLASSIRAYVNVSAPQCASACASVCNCTAFVYGSAAGSLLSNYCALTQGFPGGLDFDLVDTYYANAILNPSFNNTAAASSAAPSAPIATTLTVSAGDAGTIPAWLVYGGSVTLMGAQFASPFAPTSVGLNGPSGPGGVIQAFPTQKDATYTGLFRFSADPRTTGCGSGNTRQKTLLVTVSQQGSPVFQDSITASNFGESVPGWSYSAFSFASVATSATLAFTSLTYNTSCGPLVSQIFLYLSSSKN